MSFTSYLTFFIVCILFSLIMLLSLPKIWFKTIAVKIWFTLLLGIFLFLLLLFAKGVF